MELPKKAQKFLKEYKQLCQKHRLMILSDGEPVTIGPYQSELWGVEESTKGWYTRYPNTIKELE